MAINISCEEALAVANFLIIQLKEEREEDKSALAAMTEERDGLALALQDAGMMRLALESDVHILKAALEAVKHGNKVLTASRNDWMDKAIQKGKEWQVLQATLERVDELLLTIPDGAWCWKSELTKALATPPAPC